MSDSNPLRAYFRQPAIYIRLPSQGKFYPSDSLVMPPNQELPVFPMTALDEINNRTPDALFNGSATVKIIHSCIPNIKDAWQTPVIDLDTILISIRIASYGHEMDIEPICPKCGNEEKFGLDLRTVLEKIKQPDYSQSLQVNDLQLYFKPLTYQQANDISQNQFKDQKLIQILQDSALSEEEKIKEMSQALEKISQLTVESLAKSIAIIKTPAAAVTEPELILEWLVNAPRDDFNQVRDFAMNLKEQTSLRPINITCSACANQYQQTLTLDMTSFFAPNS